MGVRHDTLVEARIEVESAKHQLEDMYVTLDSLADDREGIWTEEERAKVRSMQKAAQILADSCGDNLDDIDDELETVRSHDH